MTGAERDRYRTYQAAVVVIVASRIEVLDPAALSVILDQMPVVSAESVVILSPKMMAKFEILGTGSVVVHCLLFLSKSAKAAQEKVVAQEPMMALVPRAFEIEDPLPLHGVRAELKAPRMDLDLPDASSRSVPSLKELLLLQNKTISGVPR